MPGIALIAVTAADLENGEQSQAYTCPLALSLQRWEALPPDSAAVTAQSIQLFANGANLPFGQYRCSPNLEFYVNEYDIIDFSPFPPALVLLSGETRQAWLFAVALSGAADFPTDQSAMPPELQAAGAALWEQNQEQFAGWDAPWEPG